MKTTDNFLSPPPHRRRPPRPANPINRTFLNSTPRPPPALEELEHEDTYWTGYVRLLIFVIVLTMVGTIAASL